MSVNSECPFKQGFSDVKKLRNSTKNIVIDFHAEDVTEKEALAEYLDGKVSAIVGTHTHIQTADERISGQGTAYISDLGMTGPPNGIIGSDPASSIRRVFNSVPYKIQVLDEDAAISGVVITIDTKTGKSTSIERVYHQSGL